MTELIPMLQEVGAVMPDDHFVGTSGGHFDTYINKDALYPHIEKVALVGKMFAQSFEDFDVDVICGPALGGIILSQWTAAAMGQSTGREVLSVYAEKKDGGLKLTRGYDKVVHGLNVAVVEDLTTTGSSLKTAIEAVKEAGGNVVACGVMVNKNADLNDDFFGVPFKALSEMVVNMYEPADCKLCQDGVPVNTTIGHGKQFVESQQ